MKSERKFNFISCEAGRLYDKHGKASNHRLFCGVCKQNYENMCHPNWHNTNGVFNLHWCINCSELLRGYADLVRHETDHLHCAYCHRHFTLQEELMQHIKLRETVTSDNTETGVAASIKKQKNTSASREVRNKLLKKLNALPSSLSMSAANTVVNEPGTRVVAGVKKQKKHICFRQSKKGITDKNKCFSYLESFYLSQKTEVFVCS